MMMAKKRENESNLASGTKHLLAKQAQMHVVRVALDHEYLCTAIFDDGSHQRTQ